MVFKLPLASTFALFTIFRIVSVTSQAAGDGKDGVMCSSTDLSATLLKAAGKVSGVATEGGSPFVSQKLLSLTKDTLFHRIVYNHSLTLSHYSPFSFAYSLLLLTASRLSRTLIKHPPTLQQLLEASRSSAFTRLRLTLQRLQLSFTRVLQA